MNESERYEEDIPYKDHRIVIWPFRNPELDKNKSWGYQIFKGEDYLMGTKGPLVILVNVKQTLN